MEFTIGQFVGWLIFLVEFALFLDGVVGEVNEQVGSVLQVEFLAAGPDVPVAVPIGFQGAVNTGEQHKMADVEFSAVVEQWLVDVALDNIGHLPTLPFFL